MRKYRWWIAAGASVVLLALLALGATAGYIARSVEVDDLNEQLRARDRELIAGTRDVGERDGRILELVQEGGDLRVTATERDAQIATLQAALESLRAASAEYLDLLGRYEQLDLAQTTLQDDFDGLSGDYAGLNGRYVALSARWADLQPILSFGIGAEAIYLDRSSSASITQSLCTGSMEPAIGCDDLLITYRPPITDLNVDDVITFKMQNATCSGSVAGKFIIHRIVDVLFRSGDVLFKTQGDANEVADRCPVPAEDVVTKVLAVIHEATLSNVSNQP